MADEYRIAPLKKGRGRGGATTGARGGGGSSLPNFFASTPSPAFGSNGNAQQPADGGMGGFGGFGTPATASSTPTFGGNTTGSGLSFGSNSNASEQPKLNPFGSLAPSTPTSTNGSGGMFGQTQQPQMGSSLFGINTAQNATPTGMFGGNNNTPTPGFGKTPGFSFGGGSTATALPMFGGGDNKPAATASAPFSFGSSAGTPVVTPPVSSSFNFGAPASTTPAANNGGYFGAPSPAPEKTPELPVTPAPSAPPSFQFGAATPTQGSSLFGKPAEPQGTSTMFGKPAEPQGSSMFRRPSLSPEPSSSGLFTPRKPTPSPEPPNHFGSLTPASAPNFFGAPKAQETPKPMFGGFGEQKQESSGDAPKSLFGVFSPAIGRREELARETPKAASPFTFGASPSRDDDSAMAGNSPPKQITFDNQPVANNPFSGFSTTPTKPPFTAPLTPTPMFPPTTPKTATTATSNTRMASPPLPSDAPSWTPTQLTEYYNLYALRSLNFSFVEGLNKMGSIGDYSAACQVYIKESAKIRAAQENGERYKGVDAKYPGLSSKRMGGEEVEGSVKRRKEGEGV